ncbi:IS110 family transposase [Actinomadura sp. HBU206391]|uniref:IS110 family transposase n=1 Tax=Actinomadura sp. HBU206391 TaxID=2731692 RepID=UPI001C9C8340|nr:IS110 family transposase [Actinomadura sp. HBU206391]
MTSISHAHLERITVGVDTHKYAHVGVALNEIGGRLAETTVTVNTDGYQQLEQWALSLGDKAVFGIEGTGSYGAGLASHLRRRGHRVVEVVRPNRQQRHLRGKNDALDAENAARAVPAGTAAAVPKSGDGCVEMIRQIKIAKDTAVKSRSQAMIALKTTMVNAPAELREELDLLSDRKLLEYCAELPHEAMETPADAARYTLRTLARRHRSLSQEIDIHERILQTLTERAAPELTSVFGIGSDSAAELLIVAGDNPERIQGEAVFAKLCGVCPIPASSGKTNRHRLYRGGHRQANAALHRIALIRMRFHEPTIEYVVRRTAEGKSKAEIMRCLKRFIAREIYHLLTRNRNMGIQTSAA